MEEAGKDERKYDYDDIIDFAIRPSDGKPCYLVDWPEQITWHSIAELNGTIKDLPPLPRK